MNVNLNNANKYNKSLNNLIKTFQEDSFVYAKCKVTFPLWFKDVVEIKGNLNNIHHDSVIESHR